MTARSALETRLIRVVLELAHGFDEVHRSAVRRVVAAAHQRVGEHERDLVMRCDVHAVVAVWVGPAGVGLARRLVDRRRTGFAGKLYLVPDVKPSDAAVVIAHPGKLGAGRGSGADRSRPPKRSCGARFQ